MKTLIKKMDEWEARLFAKKILGVSLYWWLLTTAMVILGLLIGNSLTRSVA